MPKGQRSLKRTPEVEKRILDALRLGSTFKLACQYAGIHVVTFYRWIDSDESFATKVKQVEGTAVVGWLAKIEQAATDGNWQAAAWKLERRYPEDYARRDKVDLEVYVRERARELGIDEDEALTIIKPQLRLTS